MKYILYSLMALTFFSCANNNQRKTLLSNEADKKNYEQKRIQIFEKSNFNMLMPFSEGLAVFSTDTSFGAIDSSGKIIFAKPAEKITSISAFQNGLALMVFKDTVLHYSYEDAHDHLVFIDKNGNAVFDISKNGYQNATAFNEFGYSIVKDKINKKYGVINSVFQEILPTIYEDVESIDSNRFRVSKNEKYGIVGLKNQVLVDFVFGRMEAFTSDKKMFCVNEQGWGIYDSVGILLHQYDCDELIYTGGLPLLTKTGKNYDQYAYADTTGKIIVPYGKYSDCGSFNDGLAMVYNENISSNTRNKKYKKLVGYIDVAGKEIVPLQYEDGLSFYQGLANVKKNGKWGYINTYGKVIIDFLYDDFAIFEDGYAMVTLNGKGAYIDTTGKKLNTH